MSSHWEWVDRVCREHDELKLFAPENGWSLQFSPGDEVVFTNPAGLEYVLKVTGYYERTAEPDAMYANGARYLLDWECPWYPVPESALRRVEQPVVQ